MAKRKDRDEDDTQEEEENDEGEENVEDDDDDDQPIRSKRKGVDNRLRLILVIAAGVVAAIVIGFFVSQLVSYSNQSKSTTVTPTSSKGAFKPTDSDRGGLSSAREEPEGNGLFPSMAAGLSGLACVTWVLLPFLYLALSILVGIWVIKDVRNRSMGNLVGVLWMLMIFPFNVIALIIYIASRPVGTLVVCKVCRNSKLPYKPVCPHCRSRVRRPLG